ncbi:DUF2231 domain-containing protein [Corynebacterium guangdongense]|uniref:DUF2231 domain-containing protein n=1 Tax=Corynebacterium guangdongense TaxID=1783348 RepID=A0ABU1ZYB7_9CORY|nr:DUF2231 domain-containing protein [Corynebacterium guangdongense]MDR7329942.1 hypothetical protein [Corynebacterium guangdongense]WJZ18500.1 hypothetical protein CGUA_09730 [Corynebacterium guangdongense]
MFSTVAGLPAHPLFVHGAVVLGPLAAVLLIAWALLPRANRHLFWPSLVAAVAAVPATLVAKASGEALLEAEGFSEDNPGRFAEHVQYADMLTVAVIGAAVLALGYAFVVHRGIANPGVRWLLRILLVLAAVAVLVTAALTGHEGASLVWAGSGS